jgi:thiamine-monophosphate kinase
VAGDAFHAVKLRELGEDRLIARLTRALAQGREVRVGPGDDCAVIGAPRAPRWALLKTDAVVEGVHFEPGEKMERVGWKALCRALSDIAAMGGVPRHALITLAVPPEYEMAQLDALYRGLRKAAQRFGVSIVGGETSRSPGPLFLSIALTGSVERARCILRSGGRPGDAIYVTGRLGGSRQGRHLDFVPRLEEARWLTEHAKLHAMMDLSDGLGADLPRLAAASGCGYRVNPEALPRTRGCSVDEALNDGEDFELLFALPGRAEEKLQRAWEQAFPRLPLTCIGELLERGPQTPSAARLHGFDHFA